MAQKLDIQIAIPEDYVLIRKVEWEKMLSEQLSGKHWTMKDLEQHTQRSSIWLKENVLYPHRQELDIKEGGFVRFPDGPGSPWKFGTVKMMNWLEENLERVL